MKRCAILFLLIGGSLFAAEPGAGTWKMNFAKSTFSGSSKPPRETTFVIGEHDGLIDFAANSLGTDGASTSVRYTVPIEGGRFTFLNGAPPPTTEGMLSKRQAGSRIYDFRYSDKGKVIQEGHAEVSVDGKSMRLTSKGTDSQGKQYSYTEYFDKR